MKKHKIKKSLARCLTILLIFSLFVPVLSAFSSVPSFAEETSAPTYDEVKSYTKIETSSVSFNTEKGCPFWDGNLNLPDNSEYGGKLFSDKTKSWIYVNGELATFAPAHTAPNGKGGVYFAILGVNGVNIESGTSVTITVATQTQGVNYYGEETTTAPSALIGYDSSYVKLMGTRSATITVRGKDIASKYKDSVGKTVNVRFHDDLDNREFTVKSNDGTEVVFECSNFATTSKTIAEVGYGTDRGFAVLVNENIQANQLSATDSNKVNGYYQKAPGDTNGNNMRFLFTADDETLSAGEEDGTALFQTGTAIISFMKGDSKVRSLEMGLSEFTYFRSVFADGDLYEAEDGEAVFGIVISNVPVFAWTDIEIQILSSDGTAKYSGVASKPLSEAVAMGGYVWLKDEQNIQAIGGTAESPVSGDDINRPGNAEGVNNLFDKTVAKFGAGDKEGNKGKITVTWNYDDAKTVSLYAIYTGGDSRGNNYIRNPSSWVLYGSNDSSNDGKEYVVIDTVKEPALPDEGGQGKYYEVDKPTAYQYYKIEFATNSGEYFQLGEIKMLETATSSQYSFNDMIAPPAVISSTPEVLSTTEGLAQLFDGNPNTKLGYYSNVSEFTILWSYDEAVEVTGYSLTTGNDSTVFNRNPKSWVLYGANDGLNYKEIGKGSVSHNFSGEFSIYGVDKPVGVEEPVAYKHYKIVFTVDNHHFQMADIALYN